MDLKKCLYTYEDKMTESSNIAHSTDLNLRAFFIWIFQLIATLSERVTCTDL